MNPHHNNGDINYRSLVPNTKRVLSPFSYYGSKSRLVQHYDAPTYDTIIEPFAGSAAYAWYHRITPSGIRRNVNLYDVNADTIALWHYLQSFHARYWLHRLPTEVKPGQIIADLLPDSAPDGLRLFLVAELSRGAFGKKTNSKKVSNFGAFYYYARMWAKLDIVNPDVQHWNIQQRSYESIENQEATWFIDPPYANKAGSLYRHANIDYKHLADWCRSRKGQVIVCENAGADWLPFTPLTTTRLGRHTSGSNVGEVIYTQW